MTIESVHLDSVERLRELGLSPRFVSDILLGEDVSDGGPDLVVGAPEFARWLARREYAAASRSFDALQSGSFRLRDPWTGAVRHARCGITSSAQGTLPFDMLPLYYEVKDDHGNDFWAISYGTYGRITHIFLPSENVIVHDLDPDSGGALVRQLTDELQSEHVAPHASESGHQPPTIVAVVDMVMNYGHQLMNHLSGLERLLRRAAPSDLGEIWLSGPEFFPPAERLFPELAPNIRRFANRWDMHACLRGGAHLPIRVGTNIFETGVADRLRATQRSGLMVEDRWPLVAITVRASGRRCLNLAAAMQQTILALLGKYPRIGVVLDGWTLPDSQVMLKSPVATIAGEGHHRYAVQADLEEARQICEGLPADVLVRNLIGCSASMSLAGLSGIDAYISHVGTPHHKISFLTGAPGIVHGPTRQLLDPDTGHFQTTAGRAPVFLAADAVRDVATDAVRGDGFSDYEIENISSLIDSIDRILMDVDRPAEATHPIP